MNMLGNIKNMAQTLLVPIVVLGVLVIGAVFIGKLVPGIEREPFVPVVSDEIKTVKENQKTNLLDIQIERPVGLPADIQAKVDVWVNTLKEEVAAATNDPDLQELIEKRQFSGIPFVLQVNKPKVFISGRTKSIVLEAYIFTGGAHGNQVYFTILYDVDTKKEITLSDILGKTVSYEELSKKLAPIAVVQLKRASGEGAEYSDQNNLDQSMMEMVMDGLDPKEENFSLWYAERDVIIFIFPPYQIAPYVFGAQSVGIPISDLKQ